MTGSLDADLVLEGGGVKGIALAGAISVLDERGYRFHKVAGTSAGSIVGALVAAGVRGPRLRDMMETLNYRAFRDPPLLGKLGPGGALAQILLRQGWCSGDYLRSWLGEMLSEQDVETFAQLRLNDAGADVALAERPGRDYRLLAMASDVTHGRLAHLPWDYPDHFRLDPDDVPVVDAVRASMAIPFFFTPAKCRDHVTGGTAWLVDGGMLSNFPVGVFDRTDGAEPRWPTFGIKLSGQPPSTQINTVRGVVTLTTAMLSTMVGFYDRMHIDRPDVVARTIFVDTSAVNPVDFGLSKAAAEGLFESGRAAAAKFLDGDENHPAWDWEEYKRTWRPAPATPATAGRRRAPRAAHRLAAGGGS